MQHRSKRRSCPVPPGPPFPSPFPPAFAARSQKRTASCADDSAHIPSPMSASLRALVIEVVSTVYLYNAQYNKDKDTKEELSIETTTLFKEGKWKKGDKYPKGRDKESAEISNINVSTATTTTALTTANNTATKYTELPPNYELNDDVLLRRMRN
eukprot:1185114-Prorocentrum_minimum.AAC.1